jgi:hypothetical protein
MDIRKITSELDLAADELQGQSPALALALDRVSDSLETAAGEGEASDRLKENLQTYKKHILDKLPPNLTADVSKLSVLRAAPFSMKIRFEFSTSSDRFFSRREFKILADEGIGLEAIGKDTYAGTVEADLDLGSPSKLKTSDEDRTAKLDWGIVEKFIKGISPVLENIHHDAGHIREPFDIKRKIRDNAAHAMQHIKEIWKLNPLLPRG